MRHRRDAPDTLAPDGSEIRYLVGEAHGATRASVVEVTLPAGGVSRPVWHRRVEEVWHILSGSGHVWRCPPPAAAGAPLQEFAPAAVGPGDTLVIPTGWRFQFSAGPEAPLRFLCYTSPPWPGADEAQHAEHGGLGAPTV